MVTSASLPSVKDLVPLRKCLQYLAQGSSAEVFDTNLPPPWERGPRVQRRVGRRPHESAAKPAMDYLYDDCEILAPAAPMPNSSPYSFQEAQVQMDFSKGSTRERSST